jgi:hypothetical protein
VRARDNPFATVNLHQVRYRLRGATWDQLLARLEQLRWRAAVVGPHGSGKTTFLESLVPRLQELGFKTVPLRLSEEVPRPAPGILNGVLSALDRRHVILLDGAEQLGPLSWLRFRWRTRRAGGLVITTHHPGRLPLLWRCDTAPDLLAEIVQELHAEAAENHAAPLTSLFARHQGNLRNALRELYDLHALR